MLQFIVIICLDCIRGESWKYSTGQKNGVGAFGYNSAESEQIWTKSRILWAKCWKLALADFGRDPHNSDSLKGSRNCFLLYDFTDFPSDKFYDIWKQQCPSVSPCKLSEQNFENSTIRGRFSIQTQKLITKFPGFATSGRHNSAMIQIAGNLLPNGPPTGCLVSICTVRISPVFPLDCTLRTRNIFSATSDVY